MEEGVTHRGASIVEVTTARHNRPAVGSEALTAATIVVGVVFVGKTKAVAELMADCADTINEFILGCAIKFGRAGIAAGIYAIEFFGIGRSVRPNEALIVSGEVCAGTGEDKVNHIHISVLVAVVFAEINVKVVIGSIVSGKHNRSYTGYGLRVVHRIVNFHRTDNIKLRVELTEGVVIEIVAYTTCVFDFRRNNTGVHETGEILGINHIIHDCCIVGARERTVVKLNEEHQATEIVVVVLFCGSLELSALLHRARHGTHLDGFGSDSRNEVLGRGSEERHLCGITFLGIASHHIGGHESAILEGCIDVEAFIVFNY